MVQYEKVEGNPFARQPRAAAPTATGGARLTKVDGNPFQRSAGKRKPDLLTKATGFLSHVNRGLYIGDEIAGGVTGLFRAGEALGRGRPDQIGNAFQSGMRDQRAREDAFQASNPKMAALGRGIGNAGTLAVPSGATANALIAGSRAGNMVRGAVTAGATGAAYAAADRGTVGERLTAASQTARNPVVLGLGAAGGAVAPVAQKAPKPGKAKVPTLDELTAAKGAAYKAVDEAGIMYKPEAVQALASNVTSDLAAAKVNALRHPKAISMLEDIQATAARGEPLSLTELDQLRQVVSRDVSSSTDKAERFMGRRIIDQIDQFISATGPKQVLGGDGPAAAAMLSRARNLNMRVRKIESVTSAVEKAKLRAGSTGSGGNVDNAIRQNLRGVLERSKNLTAEETAALRKAVLGGKGQNILRQVGKLSPQGNGLMAAGNLASAASFGPLGAVPGTAGLGAKWLADAITNRNVDEIVRVMATGGEVAAQVGGELTTLAARDPQVAALLRRVSARLSRAAGVAGSQRQPSVEAYVEGRPDLGYGASYGPAGQ